MARIGQPKGIASIDQAKQAFVSDFGARMVFASPWGSDYSQPLQEFDRIVHARRIHSEMQRLHKRWPGIRGKLKFINSMPSGALGWADVASGDPHLISWPGDTLPASYLAQIDAWESTGTTYSVATARRYSLLVREDIFRHELGHSLTRRDDLKNWPLTPDQSRSIISYYAGETPAEAIAEAFCLYSREDYPSGRLPAAVEAFLENMLRR